jgi:uncharacterized membrane protein (DUF4010 family)
MDFLVSILVSLGIGLIIGLEREFRLLSEKDTFAGIRTFPLTAVLGSVLATASHALGPWLIVVSVFAFVLMVASAYYVRSRSGHMGITTEISLVITLVLGIMCSLGLIKEALAAAVVTATLLSLKGVLRQFISRITEEELFAFIKFIILSMLLLPFMPDEGYGPGGILNPHGIVVVIVTISLLSFASYALMKVVGPGRGVLLAAGLGGLVSSTAVAWLFSTRSTASSGQRGLYAAGIVLSSSVMPLRIALISFLFSRSIFPILVVPCLLIAAAGWISTYILWRKAGRHTEAPDIDLGNPLELLSAFVSTILYIAVLVLVYFLRLEFGASGLYLSGLISGLVDVDAITIAMADVSTNSPQLPVIVVLIAVVSNTLLKILLVAVKADRSIRIRTSVGLAMIGVTAGTYVMTMTMGL